MSEYLDDLDDILLTQFDDGMLLSELDGYLTGLIVSPDIVPPARWLKPIWGDAPPPFDNAASLQHFLDLMMTHHNRLLESLSMPGDYAPILDSDPRTGEVLWEMWMDGFAAAMKLAPAGWNRIRASNDAEAKAALAGIIELATASARSPAFGEEQQQRLDQRATDLLPIWIPTLHAWQRSNQQDKPLAGKAKVGRNDPCPCGSGEKYKKCCAMA
ncbi:UPF0149 family protein [Sphingobium rhizovicinum]|uniref:UPF0149 family protein n=1 Tax=Sphingobium rhizovicinum TaxID=432308 RepID=A0ABV7NIC3_9SPHN